MEHKIETPFGTAIFNESTGYYRVQSVKNGFHNRFLHHLIWENHYSQPIPEGCVIHHINNIKTDNRIQNLICVPKKVHDSFHSRKNYARIVKNGFKKGKQRFCIKRNKKIIKNSFKPQNLVEWFEENYPNEYLEPWGNS